MKPRLRLPAMAMGLAMGLALFWPVLQARGQSESRVNATVKAIRKIKPSIVAIKVPGSNASQKRTVGTGVVVDERGYILTNRHVVADAKTVIVRLSDDSELPAQIVVADKNTDLAVLKVNAKLKLTPLPLGRTDDLEVGEDVIAVGHPYGYSFTVTRGIVSALGRRLELPTGGVLSGLIQTDAAINPGNSGGPLLNINGDFIGINTALRDGANGIAFAIDAATIKKLLNERLSALQVAGVSHGLQVQERATAQAGSPQRVVVAGLSEASAAAGIKKGDAIRGVGQQTISNSFDLERALWDAKPGERIPIRVVRQGQELSLTLTLTASPAATVGTNQIIR
jgi:serine protease Do